MFDLDFCGDLDRDANWVFGEKDDKIKKLVNLDACCTKCIINSRDYLRLQKKNGNINIGGIISEKKNLASKFTRRNVVCRLLALKIAKYGIKLEKHLIIGARQEEDTNDASKEGKEKNTQSDTSRKENNKEQSLVRADAVSNESWGFLDIVFGIKDKVKSLLGLKKEEKEFVSKEKDLEREAKRQKTEIGLSLLVKRFLDFVRGSDNIETYEKEAQSKKDVCSANLLKSGNADDN